MNVEINWNSIFSIELLILLWGETEKLFSKILTHSLLSLKYMIAPGNIIFFDVSLVFLMVKSVGYSPWSCNCLNKFSFCSKSSIFGFINSISIRLFSFLQLTRKSLIELLNNSNPAGRSPSKYTFMLRLSLISFRIFLLSFERVYLLSSVRSILNEKWLVIILIININAMLK